MLGYFLIFGIFMLISMMIGNRLRSKIREYGKVPMNYGLTGKEVADQMLRDNDIYDVKIVSVRGELTDHYNPAKRTINLSPAVYQGNSISAAAIAAHETGHAIQHANAYAPLQMRSALVPAVQFASQWVQWVLLAGIILVETFPTLLLVGIVLFGLMTLFSLITLPVEINASQRALAWLNNSGITTHETYPKAKDALKWAAYTYVVAALASLATLLYYVMIFLGGSRN
ncbi:MAG: zinc metallopeptidase [Bacteroidales bacterium]|nr:zinc metallopeptidase [Bacteroidales bacterium]